MTERYIDNFLNNQLPQLRIAVIGDVMVDRYVYGKVERISPEAPVPINKVNNCLLYTSPSPRDCS